MNERELAEFYEERRGDMSLWADKPSKANVRRGGTVVFSLRFGRQELELLRKRAEAESITVSELIRRAAMREATSEVLPKVMMTGPVREGDAPGEEVVFVLTPATFRVVNVDSGFQVAATPVASARIAAENSVIWD